MVGGANAMRLEDRIKIKALVDMTRLGKQVCVAGWVKRIRKLGNLCFVTLWDESGSIQIVDESGSRTFETFARLTRESVVMVEGEFRRRSNPNPGIFLGEHEIKAIGLEVIAEAKTPPLIVEDETDALEDVRLKYR